MTTPSPELLQALADQIKGLFTHEDSGIPDSELVVFRVGGEVRLHPPLSNELRALWDAHPDCPTLHHLLERLGVSLPPPTDGG
jgi:hypothetical protein